ncbi:hypothetical protein DAPPUDRAFT_108789 [Daphnia pulex]|uniref:Uncharacterized protein n=1 Tax=Daphnia pulex TaxID=6669 RepID=E9H166_DAPPU|nr:hypothetical protein DAPPUDRAFT_108789 [Daphnia pulex]|eukprot:EFX74579.1 hypothetical protein DAPPUDRAFT_108789 [Daphnia pulex]
MSETSMRRKEFSAIVERWERSVKDDQEELERAKQAEEKQLSEIGKEIKKMEDIVIPMSLGNMEDIGQDSNMLPEAVEKLDLAGEKLQETNTEFEKARAKTKKAQQAFERVKQERFDLYVLF